MTRAFALAFAALASPVLAQPIITSGPALDQALPASAASDQAKPASAAGGPRAAALFERDWVLANWALKKFDGDRDILLSTGEVAAAAAAFRELADGDGDGRVTPAEYRAAREFILARYN